MIFQGFSKETLPFLLEIRQNNTKEWFEANKDRYTKLILEPSRAFVEEFGEHLMALEPTINYAPKINKSLFRIYRDTRRPDAIAIPIKHRIGVIFWQGEGSRMQSSSFYLHFSPDELFVSVGVRWFEKPMLDAYREYIKDDKNREKLASVLEEITALGYSIIDKGYKRYPRGFDKDMKDVELSLYKGMATYKVLDPRLIENGEKFIDTLYGIYEDMLPLQQLVYEISLLH
jgi:uncharacterized protein (TIGR02453 family)